LAGLAAEVGMQEYQQRIKILKNLVTYWQQGHQVTVVVSLDEKVEDYAATGDHRLIS